MITLAAAAALLAGLGLVSAAFEAAASRAQLALRCCLALLFGLALSGTAWSLGLFALGWAGGAGDALLLALGAALLVASDARGLRLIDSARNPLYRLRAPAWLAAATALMAIFCAAIFFEHSLRYPDGGWDATAFWNVRARALARAPLRFDLAFASEQPNAGYPVALPALVAHAWRALESESPWVGVAVHALFAALAVAIPALAAAARRGTGAGLRTALVALGAPALVTFGWSQAGDVPLAALFAGAAALLVDGAPALAGLALGLGAYAKDDGAVLLAAACGAALLRLGPRALGRLMAGAAAPLALLAYFKLRLAGHDLHATPATPGALFASLADPSRWRLVGGHIVRQLWQFGDWGLALLAALAATFFCRAPRKDDERVPAAAAALAGAAYVALWLANPGDRARDPEHFVARLLFQLWPTALLALSLGVTPAPPAANAADAQCAAAG